MTNFPRKDRLTSLKNPPKLELARLPWKSRGLKWFVTLKTLSPTLALYLRSPSGRGRVFSACISSEPNVGNLPARLRGPAKFLSSSIIEIGKPLRMSRTGASEIPYFNAKFPQNKNRFGASQGNSDLSFGRMIGPSKLPKNELKSFRSPVA